MTTEGLEGVVAATSAICDVDGEQGRLSYRGINIHELADNSTFEETIYLLWHGDLPTQTQLKELSATLAANRQVAPELLELMRQFPKKATPMEVLRTAVSAMAMYDPDDTDNSPEANRRKAVRVTAQLPTVVAAAERFRNGREPIPPRTGLSHAANFLYMLTGNVPDATSEHAFDVALILHADHELNASTFAARVTAATLSDIFSTITSAIGTLAGPLHGGANEQVMRMLLKVGTVDNAEPFIRRSLNQREKIMGFGHRVYHTEDPRATHLRQMSQEIGERKRDMKWFEMSNIIENLVKREKKLYANVDFYSASVYYELDVPIDLFTPIFAISRVAGWTAHVLEQYNHNRLIRPRAEYIGRSNVTYQPMSQRQGIEIPGQV